MKIYTLVGKSGTGKSHQSPFLSQEKNIEGIIDDGLLIFNSKIVAGKSAKRQPTKIAAVKTALFTEDSHRDEVIEALKKCNPRSLLIIGTSDKMIKKIVDRLNLENPYEKIAIEDITTEKERIIAKRQREEFGKHVIPVATFQLKSHFSGYFLDPIKILKRLGPGRKQLSEKTEVRPTFSYLGEFSISDSVIKEIVEHITQETEALLQVNKIYVMNDDKGMKVQCDLILSKRAKVTQVAVAFQKKVMGEIERMTSFNVIEVNVTIKGVQ